VSDTLKRAHQPDRLQVPDNHAGLVVGKITNRPIAHCLAKLRAPIPGGPAHMPSLTVSGLRPAALPMFAEIWTCSKNFRRDTGHGDIPRSPSANRGVTHQSRSTRRAKARPSKPLTNRSCRYTSARLLPAMAASSSCGGQPANFPERAPEFHRHVCQFLANKAQGPAVRRRFHGACVTCRATPAKVSSR